MKYYINGMQVPRKQFFEFLTDDVYYDWTNNANSDFALKIITVTWKKKYARVSHIA